MEYQIGIVILVVVLIPIGVIFLHNKYGGRKRIVVVALIDIYTTGRHHVEFIPAEGIHPVDIIQLAISYMANVLWLTTSYNVEWVIGLNRLLHLSVEHCDLANEVEYRRELADLVNTPQPSLLPTGKLSVGNAERYQVRLIRGKQFDYSITQFSIRGYKPNLANSALYLYHAAVDRLDESNLKLLHASFGGLLTYFQEEKPTMKNYQIVAFAIVERMLNILPEHIENSPGRINRRGGGR